MDIWESVPAMTAIDLLICGSVTVAAWSVFRWRAEIRRLGLLGPKVIVAGLVVVAAFFLMDLGTMWLLDSEAAMQELHLNWSWIVLSSAVLVMTVGLVLTASGLRAVESRVARGERLFRNVVENQGEFIVRWMPDGTRTFVNKAYCREFQSPRDQLVGTSFFPLIATEDQDRIRRKIEALTPEAPVATDVHRVVRPDGSGGWQEWTDHAFFDDMGRLIELQSVGRDITDRKQAEEDLRRSERRYRDLFELAGDGIVLMREERIIDCNPKSLEIFGCPRDQIVGSTPSELLAPSLTRGKSSAEATRKEISRAFSGDVKDFEWRLSRPDGSHVEIEVTVATREVDGEPTLLVHLRDVTERLQAEAQYRAVFNASNDAVSISRLDDLKIITANPAFLKMTGYSLEELQELSVEQLIHPDTLAQKEKTLQVMSEGQSRLLTGQVIRKDGTLVDVSANLTPLLYRGERQILSVARDITEENRAAEELRVSEEKFSKVFHGSPAPMVISAVDPPRILSVNSAFEELFGLSEEEVSGRSSVELGLWGSPELRDQMIAELETRQSLILSDVEFRAKDGESRYFELSVFALELGTERCLAVIGRDTTERRRAEIAIRDSEEQYRAIFEAASDALSIWRLNDIKPIAVNPAFERLTGYTQQELLELPWDRYIQPGSWPPVRRIFREVVSGRDHEFVGKIVRKDGELVDVSSHWAPMLYKGERQILGVSRDLSDKLRANEELRASQERLSRIWNGSREAIAIVAMTAPRIVDVNPSMERLTGYTRDELIGQSGLDMGLWVNPQHRTKLLEDLQASGEVSNAEVQLRRRDGRILSCELTAFTLEVAGEACWVGVGRDVTDRKRIEREKEKAWMEIARLKEELERERDYLREEVTTASQYGEMVGDSPALRAVLDRIEAVAATNVGVLIQGESGVGKELVAREVHSRSARSSGPQVRVNCASVPRELFESEFFGHVKGAFTGAYRDRVGRFQLADRGTLFLDEVAEIPLELQAKLLRALQEGEYQRVGEERTRKADVRVVAATNRDLKSEVGQGRFREDLYYRLSVFPIDVPPVRERGEDVVALAQHFLGLACRELGREPMALSREQAEQLRRHDWPGNVRELRNVIEQAVILSRGERLRLDLALPESAIEVSVSDVELDDGAHLGFVTATELRRRERNNHLAALEHAGWKVSGPNGAAELLGLKATTLRYRMKALGIERPG